jgi:hypothetical protein
MTMQGPVLVPLWLLLAAGACVPGDRSGIEGISVIGPTRPSQRIGESPGQVPFPATLLILSPDGRPVARVTTGEDGRFRIDLPPGEYRVTGAEAPGRMRPRPSEETVQVLAGKVSSVSVRFDSGLR